MVIERNKNKLLITFNNFKSVNSFLKELNSLIPEDHIENLILNVSNDLKSVINLFDNSIKFEEKYIVGLIYYTKLIDRKNSGLDIDLIAKWNQINDEQKNNFINLISYEKTLKYLSSYEYLNKLNSKEIINIDALNKLFILIELFFTEFFNYIFHFAEENIKSKVMKDFHSIILNSKNLDKKINIEDYKNQCLQNIQYSISDNKLLLEHPDNFKDLILKSENTIINLSSEFIPKFLKVFNFINKQYEIIEKSLSILKNEEDEENIDQLIDMIKIQMGSYNVFYLNSVAMISTLASNRLTYFYELYNEFDNLGVFNTSYEKNVLDSLKVIENEMISLNENISMGYLMIENKLNQVIDGITSLNQAMYENIKAIYHLENRLVSSFKSLENTIAVNTSDLAKSINGHLVNIDSKIGFNNLVSVVSAYQLYRVNNPAKPLLPNLLYAAKFS
jgi:hypothetical protein